MSVSHRQPAMLFRYFPPTGSLPLRLLIPAMICVSLAIATTVLAARVAADPPNDVQHFTAEEAAPAGVAVEVTATEVGDETLLEVEVSVAERLLDVERRARLIAVAHNAEDGGGSISVRQPDGAIVRVELHGVLDATFAPDGSWLAVLDGHGSLLRLHPETGVTEPLAEGPFTGPIRFARDGSLLLRAVSSVHAPFISELVRLDPASGDQMTLSGDELVYAAFELDDGTIVYAAHDRSVGMVLMRAGKGGPERLAALSDGAIEVDVSGAGLVAYAVSGDGVYLLDPGYGLRRLASGSMPSFSPDGEELLVVEAGGSSVIGLDGSVLAELESAAAAWTCPEGCE